MLGETVGAHDVPVHIVDEEALIIEGSRSASAHTPQLLIGDPILGISGDPASRQGEVSRQICEGGPIRTLLALSGAQSVEVDWSPASVAA
ncbi:hypothetical protein [Rhodococcus sp. ACS1]|uniref:hypothetical protein n=1 Tax=Rhodococcus sp. ACS1 TaxID=2028570 RepID=UPI00211BC9D8|nr:hypothetical protein [Rhodococcus sp. ACS1]